MLQPKTRWKHIRGNEELAQQLSHTLQLSPVIASLLVHRGLHTEEEVTSFLHSERQSFHDPFLLKDMDRAVERIHTAVQNGEQILVYGDYDADGVSSTTVLMLALLELGADVEFYIPNRFTEGYGPNEAAFRWAQQAGFSLIITVDTGISAVNEAKLAKELGIDLIITDHHEPPPEIPDAYAIIHPRLKGGMYPFGELAGVGVAFKVAHALLGTVPEHLLDIAVIGTIADLVPLHDENRLLAIRGLEKLQQTKRPGLLALFQVANVQQHTATEESVGFSLAPRINAVGRLEDAAPAVHLLLSEDMEEALELAQEIDSLNKLRQDIVQEITAEAIAMVEEHYPPETNHVLVLAKEGWNVGVIGIVASRLVERFYRPTVILGIDSVKKIAKGSARSIEGFDLFANLSDCRDILPHFGGHPMAAGMTLDMDHVDELRKRLNELAAGQLSEQDLIPVKTVDAVCHLEDITLPVIEEIQQLAPFGVGNPKPRIQVENVSLESIRPIGSDGSHLKVMFTNGQTRLDGIGFGLGSLAEHISPTARVSVIGELSINEWNNFRKPQVMIQDIAITEWQLFDWRSMRGFEKQLATLPRQYLNILYFDETSLEKLPQDYRRYATSAYVPDIQSGILQGQYTVLLDLPPSLEQLHNVLACGFPARIYAVLLSDADHTFSTVPTRDHFKWFYAFLRKKSPFSLAQHGEELCRYKGWSKDTVNFMTQVFFELEFVTIKDGVIFLSHLTQKRDLTESDTYRKKFEQLQVEKELVYSAYQQLKEMLETIRNGSFVHKEDYYGS